MIRETLATLAVASVLAAGAADALAQGKANPCAAKNPCAKKAAGAATKEGRALGLERESSRSPLAPCW